MFCFSIGITTNELHCSKTSLVSLAFRMASNQREFFRKYCHSPMVPEEIQSQNNQDNGLASTAKSDVIPVSENNSKLQDKAMHDKNLSEGHLMDLKISKNSILDNMQVKVLSPSTNKEELLCSPQEGPSTAEPASPLHIHIIITDENLSEENLMDLETCQNTLLKNVQDKVLLPSPNEEDLPCSSQVGPSLYGPASKPASPLLAHIIADSVLQDGPSTRAVRSRRTEMYNFWDGTAESDSESEDSSKKKRVEIGTVTKDFRKKKKPVNKAKERKARRDRGEEYVSKKGTKVRPRAVKENPCVQKKCINGCDTITDERL
ncbi:unnamed protein product [Psylliodes chrysocephalus]|uniref:Uncharacterized protein n=1 Tax=Psylliodes chrysocephalus TaxID=3402493 RepID=A0A9P0GJE0_9CUCU|nr:unnamed protein product [Psylliodes chrysocephala]